MQNQVYMESDRNTALRDKMFTISLILSIYKFATLILKCNNKEDLKETDNQHDH